MNNLIYTKYANERREAFRIRTSIYKDEKGKLTVEKKALSEKSKQHINEIYENYLYLKKINTIPEVDINKCTRHGDILEFEYIKGTSLTEKLNSLVYENKYVELIEVLKKYVDIIRQLHGETKFTFTDEFVQVFGQVNIQEGIEAITHPNIDLIFDNILINDKINIIDYEWLFNFPVPLKYILFRSLNQYLAQLDYSKVQNEINILAIFNIDTEDVENFLQMERNFSKYVMVNYMNNYVQKATKLEHIVHEMQSKTIKSQVFLDYGEGFSEENSYMIEHKDSKYLSVEIKVEDNVEAIRIDPCESACIIKLVEIKGIKEVAIEGEDYYTNAFSVDGRKYIFLNEDPQIILKKTALDNKNIKIRCKICLLDEMLIEQIIKSNEETNQLKEKIITSTNLNENLKSDRANKIESLDGEINKLNEDIKQQQLMLEHMKEYSQEKEKEVEELYNAKKIIEEKVIQFSLELENGKQREEKLQQALVDKSNVIETLENTLEEKKREFNIAESKLDKMQQELDKVQKECNKIHNEIENINSKRAIRVLRRLLKV